MGIRGYAQQRGGSRPFGFRSEEEEVRRKDILRREEEQQRTKGRGKLPSAKEFLRSLSRTFVLFLALNFALGWVHKTYFPESYAKLQRELERQKKLKKRESTSEETPGEGATAVEGKAELVQDG